VTLTLNRPWSNLGTAHRLIIANISGKLFVNPTRGSKDKEWTQYTVIQCLILNFDLDLEQTLVKHRHCTSSHHSWHLCRVICKSNQGFKSIEPTWNRVIQCLILNSDLDLDPTLVKHRQAHRLIILDICAKLFVNPTRGSKDIERTWKCDTQTDGLTDGRTDRQRS